MNPWLRVSPSVVSSAVPSADLVLIGGACIVFIRVMNPAAAKISQAFIKIRWRKNTQPHAFTSCLRGGRHLMTVVTGGFDEESMKGTLLAPHGSDNELGVMDPHCI